MRIGARRPPPRSSPHSRLRQHQSAWPISVTGSWAAVMFGQGTVPECYHPFVDTLGDTELKPFLKNVKVDMAQPVSQQALYHEFIKFY